MVEMCSMTLDFWAPSEMTTGCYEASFLLFANARGPGPINYQMSGLPEFIVYQIPGVCLRPVYARGWNWRAHTLNDKASLTPCSFSYFPFVRHSTASNSSSRQASYTLCGTAANLQPSVHDLHHSRIVMQPDYLLLVVNFVALFIPAADITHGTVVTILAKKMSHI